MGSAFDWEIIFVDDGSTDGTLDAIRGVREKDARVKYISFSRNFGHQAALKAGLAAVKGSCVVSLDGDMQQPPQLIPVMIALWREEHCEIVYTIRKDDPHLGFVKRATSKMFYKFLNFFSGLEIEVGSADFRLLDRSVVNVINTFARIPSFFVDL